MINLTGLTSGQVYKFKLYNHHWGNEAGDRVMQIGFVTDGSGTDMTNAENTADFNEDDATQLDPAFDTYNQVYALEYEYKLAPGVTTLTVLVNASSGNYHLYALTNEKIAGPEIVYPKDGEAVASDEITFEWNNFDPNGATETYVDVWFGTDPNKVTGPGAGTYTKVVNGESISSFALTPDGAGVYYWQVDSYLNGKPTTAGGTVDYSTGDPCMIEGSVHMFTNDGPIVSVDLGPVMVTWSGEPVDLIADIDDDGGSALTYAWTTGSLPAGVTAVFDPSADVAAPSVTFTKAAYYSNANIVNAGFEAEVLDEDGWGGAPGWTQLGRMGNWNPPADAYDGSAVPEGVMCAWAQTNDGGLAQVLAETLAP
ncbi:MAG: hypothetical protein K9M75_03810, partial [Phycisphaerae bacterium]|nr:hypothetical protein [Phycisphaerae bacterium]